MSEPATEGADAPSAPNPTPGAQGGGHPVEFSEPNPPQFNMSDSGAQKAIAYTNIGAGVLGAALSIPFGPAGAAVGSALGSIADVVIDSVDTPKPPPPPPPPPLTTVEPGLQGSGTFDTVSGGNVPQALAEADAE